MKAWKPVWLFSGINSVTLAGCKKIETKAAGRKRTHQNKLRLWWMLCSEIETSSLSHPLSPYYPSSLPLFFRFPPTSRTSLPIYLPVSVCISLTRPISFCLSHMACHLCDKWTSFFSGNSPMMDFSLPLCVCAVFLAPPPQIFVSLQRWIHLLC